MNNEIIINNHEPQDITITQDDNQLIFINGGGEVIGITDVLVNGLSVVNNNIAYVIVPTKTSELTNDSGFITNETDPTVPSYVKAITVADIDNWNNKQDLLVSGTNIKTINNTSLLGSGNIDIQGGSSYSAGTGIDITNGVISNTITSYDDLSDLPTIPTQTSDLINDSDFVSEDNLSEVAFTGSYASLSDTPEIPDATSDLTNDGNGTYPFLLNKSSQYIDGIGTLGGATAQARNLAYTWDNGVIQESHTVANYDDLTNELSTKQDTLVSGTNIKTINNESLLGSGNIDIPIKSFIEATPSANVNIPSGSYTEVTNFTSQNSRGNLSISNGKIKIGSGINYVKVTATLGIDCNGDDLYSFFTKNGTTVGTWVVSTISSLNSTIREDIIPVSENDLISFNIYLGNGGTIVSNRTSIIVESI